MASRKSSNCARPGTLNSKLQTSNSLFRRGLLPPEQDDGGGVGGLHVERDEKLVRLGHPLDVLLRKRLQELVGAEQLLEVLHPVVHRQGVQSRLDLIDHLL